MKTAIVSQTSRVLDMSIEQKRAILLHELIRYIVNYSVGNCSVCVQVSISSDSIFTIHSSLLQSDAHKFKERLETFFKVKYKTNLHLQLSNDISQNNNDYSEDLLFFTYITEDCYLNSSFSSEIYIASLTLEIAQLADISRFIEDTLW